tara:strand:+ start:38 stop:574 length:537 start_codon:yes stop_codon:yes gene_type:complete
MRLWLSNATEPDCFKSATVSDDTTMEDVITRAAKKLLGQDEYSVTGSEKVFVLMHVHTPHATMAGEVDDGEDLRDGDHLVVTFDGAAWKPEKAHALGANDGHTSVVAREEGEVLLHLAANNSTGYKGVHHHKCSGSNKSFRAQAYQGRKTVSLGVYATAAEAAVAYAKYVGIPSSEVC